MARPVRSFAGGATPAESLQTLRLRLLGGFRAAVGAREIDARAWKLRRAAAIVKLLALAPGRRLHREQLMDLLWPGLEPDAAAHNLNQALYIARRVLEPTLGRKQPSRYLPLQGQTLVLCPEPPCELDVAAFESAADRAQSGDDAAAYAAAVARYTGELLPEDRYEDWASPRREALRARYLRLLLTLAELHEHAGRPDEALATLARLVAEEPTHEAAHVGLMRLYALTGQPATALRQWEQLSAILDRELGVAPSAASRALLEAIAAGAPIPEARASGVATGHPAVAPLRIAPSPRHNLPAALTSFIGREREMADLRALLAQPVSADSAPNGGRGAVRRLVTLTGPGGTGKTRLALEAATGLVPAYPGGVWLVELAPLADPALIPSAIGAALHLRTAPGQSFLGALSDAMRGRPTLLILDNCEHLIAAVVALAEALLRACPHLCVLATSREAFRIPAERVVPVPPLPVPPLPVPPRLAAHLLAYDGMRLFVERATAAAPSFALTERNAAAAAQLCRRLDGIPLALELAAARIAALTPQALNHRLDDAFRVLTGGNRAAVPRHQTLRAAVEWSYGLLDDAERTLFARLAVFAGGWTLRAAEAAAGDTPADTLETLCRLIDKSLVVVEADHGAERRYRFLETLRQFARERLRARGEEAPVRRRHAAYFVALAEEAEPALRGPDQGRWLGHLERELDNLRAALDWCEEAGADPAAAALGLRLVGALWRFWWLRGHFGEGRARIEALLALPGATPPTAARARALYALGVLTLRHADAAAGDQRHAAACFERALAIARALGDRALIAAQLLELGRIGIELDERDAARAHLAECLALERARGDHHGIALALGSLGWLSILAGRHAEARPLLEEALGTFRELRDLLYIGMTLYSLARVACYEGDYAAAHALLIECLERLPVLQYHWGVPFLLDGFARVAVGTGHPARALRLAGAAASLRADGGATPGPTWRADLDEHLDPVRRELGAAAERCWAEGQALSAEAALAYARADARDCR